MMDLKAAEEGTLVASELPEDLEGNEREALLSREASSDEEAEGEREGRR